MPNYDFDLILDVDDVTDELGDRLFEAGCDDGTSGVLNGVPMVMFGREAESLHHAISSAIRDVRKAGVDVLRIEPAGLVTEAEARDLLAQPATK